MLRRKRIKRTVKPVDTEARDRMRNLFLSIWGKRPHRSEVSTTYLGNEPLTVYFHHILPKEHYPEMMYEESNIILLTLDEHSNVENYKFKYEEINKRRTKLLETHEKSVLLRQNCQS